jgi:hypothetical protein
MKRVQLQQVVSCLLRQQFWQTLAPLCCWITLRVGYSFSEGVKWKMWKFISRGFRETFERGINLSRADVKLKKDAQNKPACCWSACPVRSFLLRQSNCVTSKAKGTSGGANEEQGGRHRADPYTSHNWLGAVSYVSSQNIFFLKVLNSLVIISKLSI